MKYEEILPLGRMKAEEDFNCGNVDKICHAMVSIAFYEEDWQWAQEKCLYFFMSDNNQLSSLAAICLGHIARVHGKIDKDKVIRILKTRLNEVELAGFIEDALGDIDMFVKE